MVSLNCMIFHDRATPCKKLKSIFRNYRFLNWNWPYLSTYFSISFCYSDDTGWLQVSAKTKVL